MGKALSGKLSCLGTGLVKVFCDPSIQPCHQDDSNEGGGGSQHTFSLK